MNNENKDNNVENKNGTTSMLVKRKASSGTHRSEKPKPPPPIKSFAAMTINRLLSTSSSALPSAGTIVNIDGGECWDVTYNLFREFEESTLLINPHYMDRYSVHELNPDIRAFLFDVMINIAAELDLSHQTLMLALHLVDRYLSTKRAEKRHLLQIGAAAMLIACKYEESVAGLEDLLPIILSCIPPDTIDRGKKKILAVELDICETLQWRITTPTMYHYIARYLIASRASYVSHETDKGTGLGLGVAEGVGTEAVVGQTQLQTQALARATAYAHAMSDSDEEVALCLCYRALSEYDLLVYSDSMLAAAIVWMVRAARCKGIISLSEGNDGQQQQLQQSQSQPLAQPQSHPWSSTLQHVSGYTEEDLVECVTAIHGVLVNEQRVIKVDQNQQAMLKRRQQQPQQPQQQAVSTHATTPTAVGTATTTTTITTTNKMRHTTTTTAHVNSKIPLPFCSPNNRGKMTRKHLKILEESGLGPEPAQGQGLASAQGQGLGLGVETMNIDGGGGGGDVVPPPTLPPSAIAPVLAPVPVPSLALPPAYTPLPPPPATIYPPYYHRAREIVCGGIQHMFGVKVYAMLVGTPAAL